MSLTVPVATPAELTDQLDPAPVAGSTVVFEGRVWSVRSDQVQLTTSPQDSAVVPEPVVREYVQHPGSVAVLALREDIAADPHLLMIRQYRHPIGAWEWELPAGLLDVSGERPWIAAARELDEEADLRAEHWDLLAEYVASPGGWNEALRIYLARGLTDVPSAERHERRDEEASITSRWVRLPDARAAVLEGRIRNAASVIGILAVDAARAGNWSTLRSVDEPWPAHPECGQR